MNTTSNIVKSIFEAEATALSQIPIVEGYDAALKIILSQVHQKNGKVVTSGLGKAGQIAQNIATTFSSTGTPSVYLHPSDAQHGDLGVIGKEDVLLLVSNSGKTFEVIQLVSLVENLHPGLKKIVITGNPESPVGQLGDAVLSTGNPAEVCPLGLTPTTSTTMMTVIGDALVVLLMKAIGFSKQEYAKRHHSGYLGEKARGEQP